MEKKKLEKLEKFLRSVGAQALRGVSLRSKLTLRSTIVLLAEKTLKALSLNSRWYADRRTYGFGYAARRTYGNRTTVIGMHADSVPQHRRWATPSGSVSVVMASHSVGSANPRLPMGDRVAVIRDKAIVFRSSSARLLPKGRKNSFRSSFARLLPKGRKNFFRSNLFALLAKNFFNS